MYRTQKKKFRKDPSTLTYFFLTLKKSELPLRVKKKLSPIMGLLYSKLPAKQHGFNEANDRLIRVCGADISPKMFV